MNVRKAIYFFAIGGLIFFYSCNKKGCTDPVATNYNEDAKKDDGSCDYLEVGESYQGGYIAYILEQGDPGYDANVQHGLIASPNDLGSLISWNDGVDYSWVGATGEMIGTGEANTKMIVDSIGDGVYAAKLCYDLEVNGYDDWYLPSKEELNKLYQNKEAIGGFSDNFYWCSTEYMEWYGWGPRAWIQFFYNGVQFGTSGSTSNSSQIENDKAAPHNVRAIRSF